MPDPGPPAARPEGPPLLEARALRKSYPDGQVVALDGVSLGVRRGEHVAIVGPSGCGKSTLLNLLGGLDRPDSGEVLFDGTPLSKFADLHRFRARHLGFVFQSFHLIPTLTAAENVLLPMFESSWPRSGWYGRAEGLLAAVRLAARAHHLPARLSVGERQRVAIARALANDPTVILADEPTGNLDSRTAAEIGELFAGFRRDRGITLVEVTHSEAASARADRVIRLVDGRVCSDERRG